MGESMEGTILYLPVGVVLHLAVNGSSRFTAPVDVRVAVTK